jgi:hypothetical protein
MVIHQISHPNQTQVENTRYRIPHYFLTKDSPHFSRLLAENDLTHEVNITDEGVTNAAFESLLLLLHPP